MKYRLDDRLHAYEGEISLSSNIAKEKKNHLSIITMLFTLKSSVAVWYTDTYVLVKNIHE